ncbi:MAG: FtsX-like permease family protein, partial [Bacteroidetes bacterium]
VVVFYIVFATIRLAIYARRMAIRSMQLMGATQGFIRRPFLLNGLLQGGLGAAVAVGLLLLLAGLLRSSLLPVSLADAPEGLEAPFIGLLSGIVLLGLVLGLAGSFFAVNRYLNRHPDELV